MRIIGGLARGRRLRSPPGRLARPTSDRVRESLFDILGQRCDGWAVLDLYAGTGAVGLEALSRGALQVTFVERDPRMLAILRANLACVAQADDPARCEIVAGDALRLGTLAGPYDLIFADPPYAGGAGGICAAVAGAPGLIGEGGRLVVEHERRSSLADQHGALTRIDTRRYGDTLLSFFECRESKQASKT